MQWPKRFGVGAGGLLALTALVREIVKKLAGRDPGPGPDGLRFPVDQALYPFAHHFVTSRASPIAGR